MLNWYRNIVNFNHYKKTIMIHKKELFEKFGIKIDWIYRMYFIYTIDESILNMQYESLDNEDLKDISNLVIGKEAEKELEKSFNNKLSQIDRYLISIGLTNRYETISPIYGLDSDKTIRLNSLQKRGVIRYKHFNTLKVANFLVFTFGMFIVSIMTTIILLLCNMFFHIF
jgi:hypothetical protein